MKDKIANLMKSEGLTSSRLAEILETQPSRISHILSGRNNPSFDLLQKILRRFPRINPDWLIMDSSVMYRDTEMQSPPPFGSLDDGGSAPIDLFGLDDVSGDALSLDLGAENFVADSSFDPGDKSHFVGVNYGRGQGQNYGVNSRENIAQNRGDFNTKNGPQNGPQNQGQNHPFQSQNLQGQKVRVERIIVLYSDGTFCTYGSR